MMRWLRVSARLASVGRYQALSRTDCLPKLVQASQSRAERTCWRLTAGLATRAEETTLQQAILSGDRLSSSRQIGGAEEAAREAGQRTYKEISSRLPGLRRHALPLKLISADPR